MAETFVWDYVYAYDPLPQQSQEFNKLYRYYENLKAARLTTTKCQDCGEVSWPPRTVCPKCMSGRLDWTDLPEEGEILIVTVQDSGVPPGFTVPIIFALLRFGEVRFLGKLVDVAEPEKLAPGQKVRFKVEAYEDGRVLPVFTLV